jgi:hypothetical protein
MLSDDESPSKPRPVKDEQKKKVQDDLGYIFDEDEVENTPYKKENLKQTKLFKNEQSVVKTEVKNIRMKQESSQSYHRVKEEHLAIKREESIKQRHSSNNNNLKRTTSDKKSSRVSDMVDSIQNIIKQKRTTLSRGDTSKDQ